CGGEADAVQHARHETSVVAKEANRRMPTDWKGNEHGVRAEEVENAKRRPRHGRHRFPRTTTSLSRQTPDCRGGSRGMYARSATVPSVGQVDTATPCVPR